MTSRIPGTVRTSAGTAHSNPSNVSAPMSRSRSRPFSTAGSANGAVAEAGDADPVGDADALGPLGDDPMEPPGIPTPPGSSVGRADEAGVGVGLSVGDGVGRAVGTDVGRGVGRSVGNGTIDGSGMTDGSGGIVTIGPIVGRGVGAGVGLGVGRGVGVAVGAGVAGPETVIVTVTVLDQATPSHTR